MRFERGSKKGDREVARKGREVRRMRERQRYIYS
jgi:hypothetical protein